MASDLSAFPVKISDQIFTDRALQNRKLLLLRWTSDNHYRRVVNYWRHLMVTNRNDHPLISGNARARLPNVILVLLRVCSFYKPLSHRDFIFGDFIFIGFTLHITLSTCFLLLTSFLFFYLLFIIFLCPMCSQHFFVRYFAVQWHHFVTQWFT